jgi:hypothetical protein
VNRIAAVTVAVACGTRGPVPPPAPPAPAPAPPTGTFTPDPAYAGLFRDGAVWPLDVVGTHSYFDDENPAADTEGQVKTSTTSRGRCRVVGVASFSWGVASQIDCDYGMRLERNFDPISGVWVADAHGLRWVDGVDLSVARQLEEGGYVILPAPPAAWHDAISTGDGGSLEQAAERRGDAWCRSYANVMGSRISETACFAADGFTEGGWSEADQGWTIEYRFSRSR